jgi:pimeloyl-ACP methyl ester carboxylesterase
MRVLVNGVRLYFDVAGAGLVPDGAAMREKPTLLLLHGGPGFDHSIFKPLLFELSDVAQVVFLDHRGHGRSEAGPQEAWNLAQWADDIQTFCTVLGIVRPIVLGSSFGGVVAMAYATRHPEHPGKLILVSTEAAPGTHVDRQVALFERFGGAEVGALARRRFVEGRHDEATMAAWLRLAYPLYTLKPRHPDIMRRTISRLEVLQWFRGPGGEGHSFDLLPALSRVKCPTLVLGGEEDPMTPIECQADIAAALPPPLVTFERLANCGHAILSDAPDRGLVILRNFISERN